METMMEANQNWHFLPLKILKIILKVICQFISLIHLNSMAEWVYLSYYMIQQRLLFAQK